MQSNLPHAPVHWLEIQPHFNDLVVATYGRGFWIVDDITPLQQLTNDVRNSDLHLFDPRPAYQFLFKEASVSQPEDSGAGTNPVYGASLNYWVGDGADLDNLKIEIVDNSGNVVRTLSGSALAREPGVNRVWWDLSLEASNTPKLRTQPLEHDHVPLTDDGWRALSEAVVCAREPSPGATPFVCRQAITF